MIIHDPKIIFIHIPKTGGTTIEKLLSINKNVGEADVGFGAHHRLEQLYERYCGPDTPKSEWRDLSEYYMFTVARNPWERYSSLYVHDKFFWESIPRNKKRTFKSIEEYVDGSIAENFFSFIEVNGAIPDNLMIMNFDEIQNEIKRVFNLMGLKTGRVVHEHKKRVTEKRCQEEVMANPVFQEAIAEMCDKEIELFGYDLPNEED